MKKAKNQYYVVWKGHSTGIFNSWDECKQQVQGFPNAVYKGFATLAEAQSAIDNDASNYIGVLAKPVIDENVRKRYGEPLKYAICVDAACSGNPGVLEYRGVRLDTGEEIFHRGPYPEGTTNIGEFLAIVTGLAWLKQNKIDLPLYSDSRNGILWVKNKRINTKLEPSKKNAALFLVVEKALKWLHENGVENKILKWETKYWGEIPADFGRK